MHDLLIYPILKYRACDCRLILPDRLTYLEYISFYLSVALPELRTGKELCLPPSVHRSGVYSVCLSRSVRPAEADVTGGLHNMQYTFLGFLYSTKRNETGFL